jgi:Protein of unknown function (DUF998)
MRPHSTDNTKTLLACGVLAAPLFVATVIVQALVRPGFDLSKQSASMLTLSTAGWVQSANFVITGALIIALAAAVRRTLSGLPGGTWAPRLLAIAGAGLAAGGVFHPDAGSGFPPGTPSGESVVRSWHGVLHMVSGSAAFIALLALCFVLARHYTSVGERRTARLSRAVGVVFAICLLASGSSDGSLFLFVGASLALLWMSVHAARLAQRVNARGGTSAVKRTVPLARHGI